MVRTQGKLVGSVALVTGAGRGVGRATVERLAEEGASLIINDLDSEAAEESVALAERVGVRAVALAGDVTDPAVPDQLVQTGLEAFGQIDVIVNNAGYIWNGAMHNHSDEQWQAMLDVHATAPFRILRAWAPWLRATARAELAAHGRARCRKVVNVSSVSGTTGAATQIAYSAGKAAVVGLTKTLAKEWGRYNVTVNCVAFGHIETRLTQAYDDAPPTIEVGGRDFRVGLTQEQVRGAAQASALGRAGQPADGAGAIALFCYPESDYVSGQVLTCAGGHA